MKSAAEYGKAFMDITDPHIHVCPFIPKDKLYKAIGNYGMEVDEKDVILLYDDTVLGSGAEGFLLTRNVLYFKEMFVSPDAFMLSSDMNYSAGRGIINKTFLVNGKKKFLITQISFATAQALVSRIDNLAKGKFDEPEMDSPRSSASGKKKCPFCAEEINAQAIKCRFCGEMLPANTPCVPEQKKSAVQDNRILAALQKYMEDGNQEELVRKLQLCSSDEAAEAEEILDRRVKENDIDAMAIAAIMILFNMDMDEDINPEYMKKAGKLMGKSANMGNRHAARILGRLKEAYANRNCGDDSSRRMVNIFLLSAAMEYNF